MDLNSAVVHLCVEGTRAEFAGKMKDARALYWQAWNTAKDDFEACIAAHYVARFQENPEDILFWNQEALNRANAVKNDLVKDFYPSLYLNMGIHTNYWATLPKPKDIMIWLPNRDTGIRKR